MLNKKILRVLFSGFIMLFMFGLLLTGCGNNTNSNSSKENTSNNESASSNENASSKEPILIGVPGPFTGGASEYGIRLQRGMEMAVNEINAKGGVHGGQQLKLVFADHEGKAENAITVTEKLINDSKVTMLVGDVTSATVTNTARIAQQNKIPYIITCGSADAITQQGYDWIFRINQPTSEMNSAALNFMTEVAKPKTIAVLYDNSALGQATVDLLKKWAPSQNIQIVNESGFQSGSADFRPIMLKLKALNPDIIYLSAYLNDASLIMRTAKELDVNPKAFIGSSGGLADPDLVKSAGDAAEYAMASTVFWPTPAYEGSQEFVDKYEKKYNQRFSGAETEGYSGIYVAADALNRAGSLKPEDIKKALSETNMQTVFGPVKFVNYDKFTNQNKIPSVLVQIIKGKHAIVYPFSIKAEEVVYPAPVWSKR